MDGKANNLSAARAGNFNDRLFEAGGTVPRFVAGFCGCSAMFAGRSLLNSLKQ